MQMSKNKIGVIEDFLPGTMKSITVQGQDYLVSNIDGIIYAIDGTCPHAKGKIAEGRLMGTVAICPKHGAEFDLRTGKNLKKPRLPFAKAADIRSYKVTVEGKDVFLEL
jgi:3-phenylpropionate/trans-cinnamate dioxygenase ferredoxin component